MARKLELLRAIRLDGEHHDVGQMVEVDDEAAAILVTAGKAKPYIAPALANPEDAPAPPADDAPLNKRLRTRKV